MIIPGVFWVCVSPWVSDQVEEQTHHRKGVISDEKQEIDLQFLMSTAVRLTQLGLIWLIKKRLKDMHYKAEVT